MITPTSITASTDFTPKTNNTKELGEFLSHRIGMFLSYGMSSFTDTNSYLDNWQLDPPPPHQFEAPATVDSAQWATEAADQIVTGKHSYSMR